MTTSEIQATDLIPSQQQEGVKTYSVFDGTNRLIEFYSAATNAVDGQTCVVTYYVYDGASSRIVKSKEDIAQWDASWDIP